MTMVATYLMFQGDAGEAVERYAVILPDFSIVSVEVPRAMFAGQRSAIIDGPVSHEFWFALSMSVLVGFEMAQASDRSFDSLSEGGEVMMPLDDYGFGPRFGRPANRFGVSWQLSLSANS